MVCGEGSSLRQVKLHGSQIHPGGAALKQALSREAFIQSLGAMPELPPPDVRVLRTEDFPQHTRHLVDYLVDGDERTEAYLLKPKCVGGPLPGLLAIHQDGEHRPYEFGKSEPAGVAGDPELQYGLELCLRGYVVLCPDRFPFESRSLARSRHADTFSRFRILWYEGDPATTGPTKELTEDLYAGCVANRLLLHGRTMLGKTLQELQRAIDVLASQPDVTAGRLGVIGHSAGGFYGAHLMFLDPRIQAACFSGGTALYRWIYGSDYLRPINGFGGVVPFGLAKLGDVDDILAALAPRPFFEAKGEGVPEDQLDQLWGKMRRRYAALGAADRLELVSYDAGHVFRRDMRERAYDWLDPWLHS